MEKADFHDSSVYFLKKNPVSLVFCNLDREKRNNVQTILSMVSIYLLNCAKCNSLIGLLCLANDFINNLSGIFTENSIGSIII